MTLSTSSSIWMSLHYAYDMHDYHLENTINRDKKMHWKYKKRDDNDEK
jgi:hypothetical protein